MTMTPESDDPLEDKLGKETPEALAVRERTVQRKGPGCQGGCALVILGGLVGIALVLVAGRVFLAHSGMAGADGILQRMAAYLTGRTTTIDVSQAAVLEQVRKLSRLETVEYSIDKIVTGQRESNVLPDALVGDKLLLIAHGEVTAGVDLSQLQPGDVSVSGDHVRIRMPKPIVFSARLDNEKTRVFSRATALLAPADPNLETEVRKAAEEQIGQAALDEGILEKAKTNAQATLQTLLYGLGFRRVEVE